MNRHVVCYLVRIAGKDDEFFTATDFNFDRAADAAYLAAREYKEEFGGTVYRTRGNLS